MDKSTAMETDLADLRGMTLDELCRRSLQDGLEPYRQVLIDQIERPGPPSARDRPAAPTDPRTHRTRTLTA